MKFTKTEIIVMKFFTSKILESFTIREVSRQIKKDIKIVHTSIKKLLEKKFIIKNKHNNIRLNYKDNAGDLAYIENLRKEEFFKKNQLIKKHLNNFLKKTKNKFFILLIFGSYVSEKQNKKSDIDILAILPKNDEEFDKQLIAGLSTLKTDIKIISVRSFREMIQKRDELNVINETLNNHVIIYGAEQFYSLLGERDVR